MKKPRPEIDHRPKNIGVTIDYAPLLGCEPGRLPTIGQPTTDQPAILPEWKGVARPGFFNKQIGYEPVFKKER